MKLIPSALCVAGAAAAFLCADAFAGAALSLQIGISPPPVVVETPPRMHRRGLVWLPGYWGWNGRAYVWVSGHYERARHGFRYVEPNWQLAGATWVFQPGYWIPLGSVPVVVAPPSAVLMQVPSGAPSVVQSGATPMMQAPPGMSVVIPGAAGTQAPTAMPQEPPVPPKP